MRYFELNTSAPLNYVVCGQLLSKDGFLHMRRNFGDNVLILVLEGTLFIQTNGRKFEVGENQFIFLRAGEEHFGTKESKGKLSYLWVHFTDELKVLQEHKIVSTSLTFPEYGTFKNDSRLQLLFRQLMDFSIETKHQNSQILNYALTVFMMDFCSQLNDNSENVKIHPLVNDICNWIKLNFQKPFTLEDLAGNFKLSPSYLSNLFKKNLNISISEYTNNLRIEFSKILLENFSVKETAYSCGFEDEKYFMKVFKKQEGVTPTQFKTAFSLKNINQ